MTIKFMADMSFMIKSKRFMTVNGIVRGLPPSNHDGTFSNGTLGDPMFELVNDKRNALVHQVVEIGGLTRHFHHHANLKPRKKSSNFFSTHHNQNTLFPLTDNRWSMRRWQWWQWLPRGACKRNTTWFQWQSSPSICGKPVRSHLGNPFNSRTTFFRLSMMWKHSTQNIIFTWTSKGNTRPNGLFLGSTNPRQFILTRSKSGNWSLPLTSPY